MQYTASAISKNQVLSNEFLKEHVVYSPTSAAFCHAFMNFQEPASDWERMRSFAAELTYAKWDKERKMQEVVRYVLSSAVDMEIKHLCLRGFEKGMRSNTPDGVVYVDDFPLAMLETKLDGGSGSFEIQLLYYYKLFVENWLKVSCCPLDEAFPCFLIGMRGTSITLYAAIRLPDSKLKWKVHYCRLAHAQFVLDQIDQSAKFLSRLKKGIKEMIDFWDYRGNSMKFDASSNHPLPCDLVAEKLSSFFVFTGHVKGNVFTGKL